MAGGSDPSRPRAMRKRKSSGAALESSGLTYELLVDLMATNQVSTTVVKRVKMFSEEQMRWIVESDGAVAGSKLASLHDTYSAHADSDSEKITGSHTYTWNKCISAVVIDCADRVIEMGSDLSNEEQEKNLFHNLRTTIVAKAAARLIEEGKLLLADVETGHLKVGKERSLAYVNTNSIIDKRMNALEGWYMASNFRSAALSCGSINLYGQTAHVLTSFEEADVEGWRQKVRNAWVKEIPGKFPDQLHTVEIPGEDDGGSNEFSVGVNEKVRRKDGVWWHINAAKGIEGEPVKASPGVVIAAALHHFKEEVVNTGGSTLCTVLRAARSFRDTIWEQFELHRAHRASGNLPPGAATLAVPAAPAADQEGENGSREDVGRLEPEEVLKLTLEISETAAAKMESMPTWCLQMELQELMESELQLVRACKRDLCGFHPIFKNKGQPGLLFAGTTEEFNTKFEKQSAVLKTFLNGWRKVATSLVAKQKQIAKEEEDDTHDEDEGEAAGLLRNLNPSRGSASRLAALKKKKLGTMREEVEAQVLLIREQAEEREASLLASYERAVEQLKEGLDRSVSELKTTLDGEMALLRSQTDIRAEQMTRLLNTLPGS